MSTTLSTFDYTPLGNLSDVVQGIANRVRLRMKRAAEDIIEIGQSLIEAKRLLKHGQFGEWLRAEFDWSEQTAANFMLVAKRFGDNPKILDFGPSVLYVLSSPSVPDSVVDELADRANSGEKITVAAVKETKARHADGDEPEPSDTAATVADDESDLQKSYERGSRYLDEVASEYADAVDAIAEKYGDEARQWILSGQSGLTIDDVIAGNGVTAAVEKWKSQAEPAPAQDAEPPLYEAALFCTDTDGTGGESPLSRADAAVRLERAIRKAAGPMNEIMGILRSMYSGKSEEYHRKRKTPGAWHTVLAVAHVLGNLEGFACCLKEDSEGETK